jgi:hypothetical protein
MRFDIYISSYFVFLRDRDSKKLCFLFEDGHVDSSTFSHKFGVPVSSNSLCLSEELNSLSAIEVEVTTEGSARASEGNHRERNRDRDVDTNLTDIDFMLEFASCSAASSEDGGTVTVRVGVDELDGVFESVDLHDTESGGEDFFLVACHFGGDVSDESRTEPVATFHSGDGELTTVDGDLGTFGFTLVDDVEGALFGLRRNHGTDISTLGVTGTNLELSNARSELTDPFLGFADEDGDGEGHAALTRSAKSGTDEGVEGVFLVSIGHDDTVVLGTHVGLDALAVLGGAFEDVFTSGVTTDERNSADVRIVTEEVDGIVATVNNVETTSGKTGFSGPASELHHAVRDTLGGLHQEGVTTSEGHGEHPHGNHGREVEGGDTRANTERLLVSVEVDVSTDVAVGAALDESGDGARVFDDFEAAEDITFGISQGLTLFTGEGFGEFLSAFADDGLELQHDTHAVGDGDFLPLVESFLGVVSSSLELFRSGLRSASDELTSSRVVNIKEFGCLGVNILTVDEVLDGGNRGSSSAKIAGTTKHCLFFINNTVKKVEDLRKYIFFLND